MKYNIIYPHIAGFGFDLQPFDTTKGLQKIQQLAYEFDIHTNNDLISGFMEIYLVSGNLKRDLVSSNFTGFTIEKVHLQYSLNYQHFHSNEQNLDYHWLKVFGTPCKDDFGLNERLELIISENVLVFLEKFKIDFAKLEEIKS